MIIIELERGFVNSLLWRESCYAGRTAAPTLKGEGSTKSISLVHASEKELIMPLKELMHTPCSWGGVGKCKIQEEGSLRAQDSELWERNPHPASDGGPPQCESKEPMGRGTRNVS